MYSRMGVASRYSCHIFCFGAVLACDIAFDHVLLAASPVRKADADGIYTLCVRLCFDLHMDPAYI